MRTLVLPLLMAALTATASKPEKMFVVVHTTDRVVEDYVCSTLNYENEASRVVRTVLKKSGGLIWHVSGGVAPFTIVNDNTYGGGGGCVTVMDANGQTATGCGVVAETRITVYVQCPGLGSDTLHLKTKATKTDAHPETPSTSKKTGFNPKKPVKVKGGDDPKPPIDKKPMKKGPRVVPPTTPDPAPPVHMKPGKKGPKATRPTPHSRPHTTPRPVQHTDHGMNTHFSGRTNTGSTAPRHGNTGSTNRSTGSTSPQRR